MMESVSTMKGRLGPLIALVSDHPKAEKQRRNLAERLSGLESAEAESQCFNGLCNWLATTHAMFIQRESPDLVESMWRHMVLTETVGYLEALSGVWETSEPDSERRACLQAAIDLLLQVKAKKKEPCSAVEGEILGALFLFVGMQNLQRGQGLLDGLHDEVFTRNELYISLSRKVRLDELVSEVRREFLGA